MSTDVQALASPEHRAVIEAMKGQLLIVLVNRLGGKAAIPVAEVDGTGGFLLNMRVDFDTATFHFETERKQ